MKFVDCKHKQFWNEKLEEMLQLGKADVYYKSIIYTLGICETTRENFDDIFNLKRGEINNPVKVSWFCIVWKEM